MSSERENRLRKIDALRREGIDPYPPRAPRPQPIAEVRAICEQGGEGRPVCVAGRIVANRGMGKAAFLNLLDQTGRIQIYLKKDLIGEKAFEIYRRLDLGDILAVTGPLMRTRTGEITVQVSEFRVLAKSLRPLPEKWHGLRDVEVRYRRRHLDLIANDEVRRIFTIRTRVISFLRRFLDERGFLEVETPMMHPIPGGAAARPFITHHNTLDMDLYLRVAPELYLKRLLVGGMEKIYEINRNFRNEGISPRHNPEFTMLELYQAYADYDVIMDLVEEMITAAAKEILGGTTLEFGKHRLDLKRPWPRRTYRELLREHAGTDRPETLLSMAKDLEIQVAGRPPAAVAHDVYEKLVEPKLVGPVFVTEYPKAISPLAKAKPGDPDVTERFELFMAGMEIANAFTELNDPIDQRKRFEAQLEEKVEGMERLDEEFLAALEVGMPPAGGLGLGIDRLIMLFTNQNSIREVILFPLLRPERPGPS